MNDDLAKLKIGFCIFLFEKEQGMKKVGLFTISMLVISVLAVGCASKDPVQATETAQISTGAEVGAQGQVGIAAQADGSSNMNAPQAQMNDMQGQPQSIQQ